MIRIVFSNPAFKAQIDYTFGVIFSVYGLGYELLSPGENRSRAPSPGMTIFYGEKPDAGPGKHIYIEMSDFFGANYLKSGSLPRRPLKSLDGLPVIFSQAGEPYVNKSASSVATNVDIVAAVFFMLTRYEEVVKDERDEFGRFPAYASLAYQENFLNRPIANEYIELLWSWIGSLDPALRRHPMWQDRRFAVCLTHDVDVVRKYELRLMVGIALRKLRSVFDLRERGHPQPVHMIPGSEHGLLRTAWDTGVEYGQVLCCLKQDPYDCFDHILDTERRRGFKSSFYFMAGDRGDRDTRYCLETRQIAKIIGKLEHSGFEVGLHGSFDSFDKPEMIAAERQRLDRAVVSKGYGCRQHYLRQRIPVTWRIQSQARLVYDTSLGFADRAGFRAGFCMPYRPFDLDRNTTLSLWELPLTVMEGSYEYPDFAQASAQAIYDDLVRHIDTVKRCGGVFVLLWHNSSLNSRGKWTRQQRSYEEVLDYIGRQDALVTSGRDLIKLWKARLDAIEGGPKR